MYGLLPEEIFQEYGCFLAIAQKQVKVIHEKSP